MLSRRRPCVGATVVGATVVVVTSVVVDDAVVVVAASVAGIDAAGSGGRESTGTMLAPSSLAVHRPSSCPWSSSTGAASGVHNAPALSGSIGVYTPSYITDIDPGARDASATDIAE